MALNDRVAYDSDVRLTEMNRERLRDNRNLLYWYKALYDSLFAGAENKTVLEIGSGTSPLKQFYPQVITSDVLNLDYLDHVFDCHDIDRYGGIADHSVDIVTLTNVLHHLRDPIHFLKNVTVKLKPNGTVVMVEPYFSVVSYPIYRLLHHEVVDFRVAQPSLPRIEGPLSTSNQAIPYMIFFSRPEWLEQLRGYYKLSEMEFSYFSSLSYMLTGGISRNFHVPSWIYRRLFSLDVGLARVAPKVFASFFIAKLAVAGDP